MLIALAGNSKGELAGLKNWREFDGRAEKHGMSTIPSRYEGSLSQDRQWT
jgi:hypothetical protein